MSLYPSLEDMKADKMLRAQQQQEMQHSPIMTSGPPPSYSGAYHSAPMAEDKALSLYPSLDEYMGISLSQVVLPAAAVAPYQPQATTAGNVVAPLTNTNLGYYRGQVNHGLREVVFCKDRRGKVGLRLEAIHKGVFVILVEKDSPAALVGLRFGDQVLSINEEYVAGMSLRQVHDIIKKAKADRITMAVRDRPFERTITMLKDSVGNCGFDFNQGKITTLVKDSSAVRNGLLCDHHLLEVNGQNVVGLKDSFVKDLIRSSSGSVTVTVMPSVVYNELLKHTSGSIIKKLMDHSIPDL